MSEQSITLHCQKGSSDKVYQVRLFAQGDGWMVEGASARRGAALKPQPKTASPVTLDAAQKVYDKLVKSKIKGGYKTSEDEATQLVGEDIGERAPFDLQLLNTITEAEALALCHDDNWWLQEKMDGERRASHTSTEGLRGINRRSFYVPLPATIADSLQYISEQYCMDFTVDGEQIGDILHLFDMMSMAGGDTVAWPFSRRYDHLVTHFADHRDNIKVVPVARTTAEKLALFNRVKDANGEGVVFRRHAAIYSEGKPSSGGDCLKFKFYDECSVVVTGQNTGKRSVSIALLEGGTLTPVGNVTVPANHEIPAEGSVIEVRYLYAYRGGSLYQPVFEKPRPDVVPSECVMGQLKYKPDVAA